MDLLTNPIRSFLNNCPTILVSSLGNFVLFRITSNKNLLLQLVKFSLVENDMTRYLSVWMTYFKWDWMYPHKLKLPYMVINKETALKIYVKIGVRFNHPQLYWLALLVKQRDNLRWISSKWRWNKEMRLLILLTAISMAFLQGNLTLIAHFNRKSSKNQWEMWSRNDPETPSLLGSC